MKAIFLVPLEVDILAQLNQIADKYQTTVYLDDDGISHYLLIKPKLQIKKRVDAKNFILKVWGATQEDIDYLTTFWNVPQEISRESMTPIEFANELISLPDYKNKTKEELFELLELNEKKFMQYKKALTVITKKPNCDENLKLALAILNKY